jgi:nucleotide-binding universal stress UspA family protein
VYRRILVPVENSAADETILTHVSALSDLTGAALVLVHVADGFAARHFEDLHLRESDEIKADRAYLVQVAERLTTPTRQVTTMLRMGDPATEIIRAAADAGADLIAMSTHGHRFLNDLLHGSTADRVRHEVGIPVLLLRAPARDRGQKA